MQPFLTEFLRYKATGEKALAQVNEAQMNRVPAHDANSMAMLVRHLSGNLKSRFTDFLTSDGEKPWRERDGEFEERPYSRVEVDQMWEEGWDVLLGAIRGLDPGQSGASVRIRSMPLRVDEALARSSCHIAYHVGQLVLLARMAQGNSWEWISVPKGGSKAYNLNPTKEKSPDGLSNPKTGSNGH